MSKEVKEPAVRMIKRDTISTAKAWGIRLAAVALSLIVAGLVIVAITKQKDRKSTRLNSSHIL